jgi:phosphoglycerol transferase
MMSQAPEGQGPPLVLRRVRWQGIVLAAIQALVIGAALFLLLRGWRRDWQVPFSFQSDGIFYLMQSKSTIDNGWWWFNPMIGAPFGFDALAFPANSNVDQLIVWIVSRFVPDALTAINLTWLSIVVLSGWIATWCARQLGVSQAGALIVGVLFALSPYALFKHLAHFGMVVYLVPFACLAAMYLACATFSQQSRRTKLVLHIGCALLAFNYIYYPFFGSFLILVGTLIGWGLSRRLVVVRAGLTLVLLIGACTLLNLAPSFYSWNRHGRPVLVDDKRPGQAEQYGLRIRTLVGPTAPHVFPPFQRWADAEVGAGYADENESSHARLGVVGTAGFLALLGVLLVPAAASRLTLPQSVVGASRLAAATLLLATAGGFGSVFSLLISPQIRVYSRIFPFVDFFALLMVAVLLDTAFKRRPARIAAAAVVIAVGLLDQQGAAARLNIEYERTARELPPLKAFVRQLESRLPDRAAVLQLPFRTYLQYATIARHEPFDHLKLYLVSKRIRWSYPALSNEQMAWQARAIRLQAGQLPAQMVRAGFSAILIDRYGYDDNGAGVIGAMQALLGDAQPIADSERYVAYDIRSLPAAAEDAFALPLERSVLLASCTWRSLIGVNEIVGQPRPPPGQALAVPRSGRIRVLGWAIDEAAKAPVTNVEVVIDGTSYPAVYGLDRPDVSTFFNNSAYQQSGFVFEIAAASAGEGSRTLSVRATSADGKCFYSTAPIDLVIR